MCKSIALKLRCLRVAYLLEVLHSISREAVLRTAAAPFELPGWNRADNQAVTSVRTTRRVTRPIIRLVVDLIIRLVVYYQPKADNPADNPAVSFVVCRTLPRF